MNAEIQDAKIVKSPTGGGTAPETRFVINIAAATARITITNSAMWYTVGSISPLR